MVAVSLLQKNTHQQNALGSLQNFGLDLFATSSNRIPGIQNLFHKSLSLIP